MPWYYRTTFIVLMLASVGPFVLPLIWLHPQMKTVTKYLITALVIILTVALTFGTMESLRVLKEFYRMLGKM